MTVHIGEITSEVTSTAPPAAPATEELSMWEERTRLAAQLARLERDRLRTATGEGR